MDCLLIAVNIERKGAGGVVQWGLKIVPVRPVSQHDPAPSQYKQSEYLISAINNNLDNDCQQYTTIQSLTFEYSFTIEAEVRR